MSDIIRRRRLEWLGHVVRMSDDRIPKQYCFGCLEKTRPPTGPRLIFKDCIANDLKRLGMPQNWHPLSQNLQAWHAAYSVVLLSPPILQSVLSPVCDRLSSPSGIRRHKCTEQRELPVHLQRGARQCVICNRWFRSAGGLAGHKCTPPVALQSRAQSPPPPIENTNSCHAVPGMAHCFRYCSGCHRCFSSNPATLTAASKDLYATVDGDFDRLRTCIGIDVQSDVCRFLLLALLYVPLYGAGWPVSGS